MKLGYLLLLSFIVCANATKWNFAVLSDLHIGDNDANATLRLKSAVQGINSLIGNGTDIRMVFITGDLTTSALQEQWDEVHTILNTLKVVYYPTIGNHDQQSYNATWETPTPAGDQMFEKTFTSIVHKPNIKAYPPSTVYNPQQKIYSWFQNYYFQIDNNVYVVLDWNSRAPAVAQLGYKGTMPTAELQNYAGGTLPWLNDTLAILANASKSSAVPLRIIFFQHHPYRVPDGVPEDIYSFSTAKKDAIRAVLGRYTLNYWGVFAGHFHRWFNGTAFDQDKTFLQWETSACKVDNAFTLVTLDTTQSNNIVNIQKMYGPLI